MNISGVTTTAQVLPGNQQMTQSQDIAEAASVTGADAIQTAVQMDVAVMNMAQNAFEQAANELISSMAAQTGIGSNLDIQA